MTIKKISEKIKELKTIIMPLLQEVFDEQAWAEFIESEEIDQPGIYKIREDDLPLMRDLKALLNMLSSIENAADKMSAKYARITTSAIYTVSITDELTTFYKYYKVYRSTNSILTHYLGYLQEISLTVILPELIKRLRELGALCTTENLDKVSDFMIEQVIKLEQYQNNYNQQKLNKLESKEITPIDKTEKNEDIITTLVKKNEANLKWIYGDKFESYFYNYLKPEDKKNLGDFYPENPKDNDVIRNLKRLSNGLIGIKKVLEDHEAYQQSNAVGSLYHATSLIKNLRNVYTYLSEFDYQAIIAEKSTPFTEEIKQQLKKLNHILEFVACVADQFELEFRLKEGTLLRMVDLLIDRHNQMMSELRINVDHIKQKHTFYKARIKFRDDYVAKIDEQIEELKLFLRIKQSPLMDMKPLINAKLRQYIEKYNDEICMDRDNLKIYQDYLEKAFEVQRGFKSYIKSQIEYLGNCLGLTKHAELMSAFYNRLKYLERQRLYILDKNKQLHTFHNEKPYDNFTIADVNKFGHQHVILTLLKNRYAEITNENQKLLANAVMKKEVPVVTREVTNKDTKNVPKEAKLESLIDKIKLIEKNIDKDKTKHRVMNQIQLKHKELCFFDDSLKRYEIEQVLPSTDSIDKNVGLSTKSVILLHEINELVIPPEQKLGA